MVGKAGDERVRVLGEEVACAGTCTCLVCVSVCDYKTYFAECTDHTQQKPILVPSLATISISFVIAWE